MLIGWAVGIIGFVGIVLLLLWFVKVSVLMQYRRVEKDDYVSFQIKSPIVLSAIKVEVPQLDLHFPWHEDMLKVKVEEQATNMETRAKISLDELKCLYHKFEPYFPIITPRIRAFIRKTEINELKLQACVGLEDPFYTALSTGIIQSGIYTALGALSAKVKRWTARPKVAVYPNYQKACVFVDMNCIFALRLGDIISIGTVFLWQLILRKRWLHNGRTSNTGSNGKCHGQHQTDG